jgi:hypothetical protein
MRTKSGYALLLRDLRSLAWRETDLDEDDERQLRADWSPRH